jgi:predicted dehydrogenase
MINHSANYTLQARQARDAIQTGKIGTVRHITGSFASPLKWIFEEKSHTGWNEPTGQMRGNGFSWGQMCHLLGWIYHAVPTLQPSVVSCDMIHSETTGADIAVSATIRCRHRSTSEAKAASVATEESGGGDAVMSLSGTTLLPGYEHSEESVGKRVHIEIYGTHGALFYSGSSDQPSSGKLVMVDEHAKQTVLNDSFEFEQLDYDGHTRPESLMNWIAACQGRSDYYVGADCELGVRTVETVAAMYESDHLKQPVTIDRKKTTDALNF